MIGAFALAVVMLGSSACSTDPTADASDTSTTTTTTTAAESETADESDATSTTTMGDGDGDPTEDTSPGVSFYAGPDDDISLSNCDPFAQDCIEGEKCVASLDEDDDPSTACVPVTGVGLPGEPCTYGGLATPVDDCGLDSACFFIEEIDGQLVGVCTAFCVGTPDDPLCDEGTTCYLGHEGTFNMCVPTCHPLMQDCGPAQACGWHDDDFGCLLEGQAATGEPCLDVDQCGAGDACVMAELLPVCDGPACCTKFCDIADPNFECTLVGTQCVSFWAQGEPVPGYEDVGLCVVP